MKQFEYIYNVIYYFFYRGGISFAKGIHKVNPLKPIIYLIYTIPFIKNKFKKNGLDNPYAWHMEKYEKNIQKRIIENPKLGFATIVGHGISAPSLAGLYASIYHIIVYTFFPRSEADFIYQIIIFFTLAYTTDIILVQTYNKEENYIKLFNEKKGWWRIKWTTIAWLTPFLSISLSVTTSEQGDIGKFLLSLSGH